jgi:hypothetical protein
MIKFLLVRYFESSAPSQLQLNSVLAVVVATRRREGLHIPAFYCRSNTCERLRQKPFTNFENLNLTQPPD